MQIYGADIFCGAGGASIGMRRAHIDLALAVDSDADAVETYRANFEEIEDDLVLRQWDVSERDADIVWQWDFDKRPSVWFGCAPCQPFSTVGRRNPRRAGEDDLMGVFATIATDVRADVIISENVPGIAGARSGWGAVEYLEGEGYHVTSRVWPLQRWGVPQRRHRWLLLASRHGPFFVPPATHGPWAHRQTDIMKELGLERFRTVRDAIGDLPALDAGEGSGLHKASRLSAKNLERIRRARPGMRNYGPGFTSAYCRMLADGLGPTITTRAHNVSCGMFAHPEQHRGLTPRECARLQTFPDSYGFHGSRTSVMRQIGNALPPRAAIVLALAARRHLEEHLG